jgi:surface antigen
VAVFERQGGGHVGFVDSVNADGSLNILGGNQGDAVNVRRFTRDRLIALRWPAGVAIAGAAPLATAAAAVSTRED